MRGEKTRCPPAMLHPPATLHRRRRRLPKACSAVLPCCWMSKTLRWPSFSQKADVSNEPAAIPNVYPLDESVNVFHLEVENKRYAAVEANPDARIEWEDIQGHMSAPSVGAGRRRETYLDDVRQGTRREDEAAVKGQHQPPLGSCLSTIGSFRHLSSSARLASERSWTVDSQEKEHRYSTRR